jgi:hypothetical protein
MAAPAGASSLNSQTCARCRYPAEEGSFFEKSVVWKEEGNSFRVQFKCGHGLFFCDPCKRLKIGSSCDHEGCAVVVSKTALNVLKAADPKVQEAELSEFRSFIDRYNGAVALESEKKNKIIKRIVQDMRDWLETRLNSNAPILTRLPLRGYSPSPIFLHLLIDSIRKENLKMTEYLLRDWLRELSGDGMVDALNAAVGIKGENRQLIHNALLAAIDRQRQARQEVAPAEHKLDAQGLGLASPSSASSVSSRSDQIEIAQFVTFINGYNIENKNPSDDLKNRLNPIVRGFAVWFQQLVSLNSSLLQKLPDILKISYPQLLNSELFGSTLVFLIVNRNVPLVHIILPLFSHLISIPELTSALSYAKVMPDLNGSRERIVGLVQKAYNCRTVEESLPFQEGVLLDRVVVGKVLAYNTIKNTPPFQPERLVQIRESLYRDIESLIDRKLDEVIPVLEALHIESDIFNSMLLQAIQSQDVRVAAFLVTHMLGCFSALQIRFAIQLLEKKGPKELIPLFQATLPALENLPK